MHLDPPLTARMTDDARPAQDPLYYLANFQMLLDTLGQRDSDLLSADERQFMADFKGLPRDAQALLVRMVMRKGPLFRASRLRYPEISSIGAAACCLVRLAWIEDRPLMNLDEVFSLFTKSEVAEHFALPRQHRSELKSQVLAENRDAFPERRSLQDWGVVPDTVYRLTVAPLCLRLRLMFFGNFHQDLKEFVLADLGIFKYEKISLRAASRPFSLRPHVDVFHALYRCREMLHERAEPCEIERELPQRVTDCDWLEERREKLRFQIARLHEKAGNTDRAREIYSTCSHPPARLRAERLNALLGGANRRRVRNAAAVPGFDLRIERSADGRPVEHLVADILRASSAAPSQVVFVENSLINALFGLLCWRALFAPVPGAFFHRFHRDPADLSSAGFRARRHEEFAACFAELETGGYKDTILRRFAQSHGIASSFVAWGLIDEGLLRAALACIPAAHLKLWFEWMLCDMRAHRAGFPDLVQFFPQSQAYRLIEVKAPGDRLQDNQRSCIEFMLAHGMPVSVCRVQWAASEAQVPTPLRH